MAKKPSLRYIILAAFILAIAITGFWLSQDDPGGMTANKTALPTEKPDVSVADSNDDIAAASLPEKTKKKPASMAVLAKKPNNDPDWASKAEVALTDPNLATRIDTVLDLRFQLTRESVELLARFINDSSDVVATEAIDALGYIASHSDMREMIYEILTQKALDKNYMFRGHALTTATVLSDGDQILAVISDFANSPDGDDHVLAARTLSYLHTPACLPIIQSLLEVTDSEDVMRQAAIALARIGTPEAQEMLSAGLVSGDEQWQNYSTWALTRKADAEGVAELADALADDLLNTKAVDIVAGSPASAGVFGELLSRSDIDTDAKIDWLASIAKNARAAPGSTRNELASMLAKQVSQQSTNPQGQKEEALTAAILDAAAASSGNQLNEELEKEVKDKLNSTSFLVQEAALGAFVQLCTPANYKELLPLYWDEDEKIRRTAFFFSEQFLNDQEDIETLKKAREHEDEMIARSADVLLRNVFRGS